MAFLSSSLEWAREDFGSYGSILEEPPSPSHFGSSSSGREGHHTPVIAAFSKHQAFHFFASTARLAGVTGATTFHILHEILIEEKVGNGPTGSDIIKVYLLCIPGSEVSFQWGRIRTLDGT